MGRGVLIEEVTHQQRLAGDRAVVIELSEGNTVDAQGRASPTARGKSMPGNL